MSVAAALPILLPVVLGWRLQASGGRPTPSAAPWARPRGPDPLPALSISVHAGRVSRICSSRPGSTGSDAARGARGRSRPRCRSSSFPVFGRRGVAIGCGYRGDHGGYGTPRRGPMTSDPIGDGEMPPRRGDEGTNRAHQSAHKESSVQGRPRGQRRRSRPGPSTRSARVTARRASRPSCPARTSPPGVGVGFGRIGTGRAAGRATSCTRRRRRRASRDARR